MKGKTKRKDSRKDFSMFPQDDTVAIQVVTFCNNKVFCSHNGWSRENGNRAADTNNDGCRLAVILVLARDNGVGKDAHVPTGNSAAHNFCYL